MDKAKSLKFLEKLLNTDANLIEVALNNHSPNTLKHVDYFFRWKGLFNQGVALSVFMTFSFFNFPANTFANKVVQWGFCAPLFAGALLYGIYERNRFIRSGLQKIEKDCRRALSLEFGPCNLAPPTEPPPSAPAPEI